MIRYRLHNAVIQRRRRFGLCLADGCFDLFFADRAFIHNDRWAIDKLKSDEVINVLILCSNGLSSETLLARVSEKAVDCKTAALVVTADNEYKESNYHVARCVSELQALNLNVDIIDLDRHPADLLLKYDVVEFIGGNPYYLLHTIRKNNSTEVLRRIATTKILIGWSAAVFVFGPTLELVNCYSPEMNFLGLTDLSGLSLTDVQVLPHYSKFLSRFERFEEKCCVYEKEHDVNVIRINDGDGVFIDGEIHICKV
jgi:dipeptidase E